MPHKSIFVISFPRFRGFAFDNRNMGPIRECEEKRGVWRGEDEELREMEVEEKKRIYCDQIPYFCHQKKNRGPLPKVR